MGGVTFAISSGGAGHPIDFYVKWNLASTGESLADEAERMRWLAGKHPVPDVVALVVDDAEEFLVTRALPGESAVSERWAADTGTALRALGSGLRRLHDVPIEGCPFGWEADRRVLLASGNTRLLGEVPYVDTLVLCQGDPCAPNTLLAADGSFLAHVDLARLGVADRWADLAVMSMSLAWNFREFDERIFWEAYGVEPDPVRIDFYRRLWNAE